MHKYHFQPQYCCVRIYLRSHVESTLRVRQTARRSSVQWGCANSTENRQYDCGALIHYTAFVWIYRAMTGQSRFTSSAQSWAAGRVCSLQYCCYWNHWNKVEQSEFMRLHWERMSQKSWTKSNICTKQVIAAFEGYCWELTVSIDHVNPRGRNQEFLRCSSCSSSWGKKNYNGLTT